MEYATLLKSGIKISRIGIGALQGSGYSKDLDKAFSRTIKLALERGINFIDSAEGYGNGHAEKLVSQALSNTLKNERQNIVLASKFSHNHSTGPEIRRSLEATLKRFNTDYIDIYQQHWPPTSPKLSETLYELSLLKTEGKIRAIGVCNWMEPEFSEIEDLSLIDTLQPCYNLLWRSIEKNIVPLCQREKIDILSYSPLAQGLLTGKPFKPYRDKNILFQESYKPTRDPVLNLLNDLSLQYSKTCAQIALRWVLQSKVSAPIVGASTPEQLTENLAAFGWELSEEDIERLNLISAPASQNLKPHDTMWSWHSRGL